MSITLKHNERCFPLSSALATVAALLSVIPLTHAAVTEAWVHRYSNVVSNSDDRAIKVVRDAAGDIIVIGTTAGGISQKDMLTIKHSGLDGRILWQQRYNGPANRDDIAKAVAVDGSGNVVVTGYSDTAVGTNTTYIAKYSAASGAIIWEKRHEGSSVDYEAPVAVDASGNVVVTGVSYSPEGHPNAYTAKYAAADGARLWTQHPTNNESYVRTIAVDSSGNVIVTWFTNYQTGSYTTKYAAADGMILWQNRFTGGMAEAVAADSNGNVVVTGYSRTEKYAAVDGTLIWGQSFSFGNFFGAGRLLAVDRSGDVVVTGMADGYYTVKYAGADGALLWEQHRPGALGSFADFTHVDPTVALDGNGNVLVTGSFYRDFDELSQVPSNADYYTAKYASADGALLWERRYNGPANNIDHANAITVDGSGNAIVTGYSLNSYANNPFGAQANYDFYTAKYAAADGALLWEQRYDGSAIQIAYPHAIAVDGSGNVAVTGVAYIQNDSHVLGDGDFYTAKYSAANGALLWERRYNGPGNSHDEANAIVMDGSGNVVVTGSSYDGTNYGYTAKYAAANGVLLWERRGPGGGSAVVVDESGNVVVTGASWNGTNSDFYTAKFAAVDGALLWEQRYNGPTNGNDGANAVAFDSSGNVVVTGTSDNGTSFDYYTAKYATADGALLWEKRYNGLGNYTDDANAVVLDGTGNVVVTGRSFNGTRYDQADYYTAKYATADGALLWEKRYNGPANGGDVAFAVAVDGSGNVVVAGSSLNTNDNVDPNDNVDYYTAKYAAGDGALLWEKRYNGPANRGDHLVTARSLALGPDGMVAVTGSSEGGYATVVYRELDARSSKENVLAELIALRATVTDRNDGRKLNEAIRHLTKSLAANFWVDETHLERKHARSVFHQDKLTISKLRHLIKSRTSQIPDAVLQGFVDRILQADRLLASVAIDDAIANGVSSKKIEQAQKFLAKGDANAADGTCSRAIEAYRNAWKLAARTSSQPRN